MGSRSFVSITSPTLSINLDAASRLLHGRNQLEYLTQSTFMWACIYIYIYPLQSPRLRSRPKAYISTTPLNVVGTVFPRTRGLSRISDRRTTFYFLVRVSHVVGPTQFPVLSFKPQALFSANPQGRL